MSKCLNCKKETTNPKFCNKSCAAVYNNKLYPKRKKKIYICKICGVQIPQRRKFCDEHNSQIINWSAITYEKITGKRNYQKHSRIRNLARRIYLKSDKPKKCIKCGYDKHFHVCHKKGINAFSYDTPVSVINDLSNLVALCPNHHWEFDNGLLSL
jgi:hypothetical protein